MDIVIVASAQIIVFGFGVFVGIYSQRKNLFNSKEEAPPIDDFDYSKYKTNDKKFFTSKHIRSDDE